MRCKGSTTGLHSLPRENQLEIFIILNYVCVCVVVGGRGCGISSGVPTDRGIRSRSSYRRL